MSTNANRKEALEWAEVSQDDKTLAVVHGLLYVGDMLADLGLVVANGTGKPHIVPPSPKLQALLSKSTPFTAEAEQAMIEASNGVTPGAKRFNSKGPRHDPALWKKLPDGRWQSPTGRKYQPWTRTVFGVITSRRKLNLPI